MNKKVLLLATAVVLFVGLVSAEVVVFDHYFTDASFEDGKIHITREVRLKNTGQTPIIPGELHFRLYERDGDKKIPLEVSDFVATGRDGALSTKITERNRETDMSIQVWNPLLPGFHYDFTMSYVLDFKPSGILFYEIRLPQEETTIPIINEETTFTMKDNYHVTYAPGSNVNKISGNTVVQWAEDDDKRVVEYSRIPLPRTGLRAVNLFWVIIILLLGLLFVVNVRKQKKRVVPQQPVYQNYQQPPPGFGGQ